MKIFITVIILFLYSLNPVSGNNLYIINNDSLPNINTLEDKIFGLSKIWSEIKYNFVNIDHINFDLDSLYNTAIPKVISTTNDIDYYDELQRFIATFNDGHTELLQRTYGWNEVNDYIPTGIIDIGDNIYFESIKKNANLDSTLVGAKIVEIEGLPTKGYIERYIYPNISASTENHRWSQAVMKIQGDRKGTYFNGKALKTDGEIVPFSILRNGETTRTPNDQYWSWASEKAPLKRQRISLDWENDIAVMNIRTFGTDAIKKDIDSLAVLINGKAKGLVIDLRQNGGGSSDVGWHLQKYLTRDKYFLTFGSQTRINNGYGRSQGNYRDKYKDFFMDKAYESKKPDTIRVEESIKAFSCPVVIMAGRYTFSAAEDFLVGIYEAPGRPIIIGEPTGGSTGAPLVIMLPHKAVARICTLRILFPYSGKPFVGKGIQPDILVKQSVADYLEGKDVVLEKAISLIDR